MKQTDRKGRVSVDLSGTAPSWTLALLPIVSISPTLTELGPLAPAPLSLQGETGGTRASSIKVSGSSSSAEKKTLTQLFPLLTSLVITQVLHTKCMQYIW
jgi:hypothetical protein